MILRVRVSAVISISWLGSRPLPVADVPPERDRLLEYRLLLDLDEDRPAPDVASTWGRKRDSRILTSSSGSAFSSL